MSAAGELNVSWTDNSSNEDGFRIERKTGTTGSYAQIATVGSNTTSYRDASLSAGVSYCYRVAAYNTAGVSPFSTEACAPARATTATLSITKAGTGSGTVSSSPAGINCGGTCSASYNMGTVIALTATPASGSIFAGWSSSCANGSMTLNSNTSCTATFQPQPTQNYLLSIAKSGTGSGTVTSSPAGVNCGSTCTASFNSGSTVALTAMPASGSTFSGWSGTGCSSGTVIVNGNMNCTAAFSTTIQRFALNVSVVKTTTSNGTGDGTVTSSPAGISCGSTCSASYNSGTVITLTATPASNSTFTGWSGTSCNNGSVTLTANTNCTATFAPKAPQTYILSVTKSGTGQGTVTSNPAGINCGTSCSASYNQGTIVTLMPSPAAGSTFTGWSGAGCGAAVTVNANLNCSAVFASQTATNPTATRIGVFRPRTGEWFLDKNGNGKWDGCNLDRCIRSFGQPEDLPVTGDWTGAGVTGLGTFTALTGTWRLDTNGDGVLDCLEDTCGAGFGQPGDFPVIRDLGDNDGPMIGVFTPRSVTTNRRGDRVTIRGQWKFDNDHDSTFDGCEIDDCTKFGDTDALAVVGDWSGKGRQDIGIFVPRKGLWYLDLNGNEVWDGCSTDKCLGSFGIKGDLPVAGDWDGTGTVRIGVFRPSSGMWYLDRNGNGKLDGCQIDACAGPFGEAGDLPAMGKW